MAARLSRREAGAKRWLNEYYTQAADIAKALEHYDIVPTTKPEAQALLFSRLSNAIFNAPIRAVLLPSVRQVKSWTSSCLRYAINTNDDRSNIINLILEDNGFLNNKAGDATSIEQGKTLTGRLIGEKRFAYAKHIYALVPRTKVARLANPAFDDGDRSASFGAMGWQIPSDPNAGGGFLGTKGQGAPALSIFANLATTQTVASHLLDLQPGSYDFSVQLSKLRRGDGGYVRFQLRCPSGSAAKPVGIFDIDPKRPLAPLDVSGNCTVQILEIIGSGGKVQLGWKRPSKTYRSHNRQDDR